MRHDGVDTALTQLCRYIDDINVSDINKQGLYPKQFKMNVILDEGS